MGNSVRHYETCLALSNQPAKLTMMRKVREMGSAALSRKAKERAADLAPVLGELRSAGITSLAAMARELTERRIPTARGGSEWSAVQVARVLGKLAN